MLTNLPNFYEMKKRRHIKAWLFIRFLTPYLNYMTVRNTKCHIVAVIYWSWVNSQMNNRALIYSKYLNWIHKWIEKITRTNFFMYTYIGTMIHIFMWFSLRIFHLTEEYSSWKRHVPYSKSFMLHGIEK